MLSCMPKSLIINFLKKLAACNHEVCAFLYLEYIVLWICKPTCFQSSSRSQNIYPMNVIHRCKIDFQTHWERNLLTCKVMFYLFDNRHIYTAALDALGKSRRPVEALNIFHAMQVIHAKSLFFQCGNMGNFPNILSFPSSNKCPRILI